MKRFLLKIQLLLMIMFVGVMPAIGSQSGGGAVLTEAAVRRVVTAYLLQRTENMGVELRIKQLGYSGEISLPPGRVAYEIVAPPDWEGWGRASLAFIVRVDDRVAKNLTLNVEVEAMAGIVVATRPLDYGMLVKSGDVVMQKRDLAQAQGKFCRDIGEVIGKRVRVGMRSNTPVRSDYLEKPPLVKSGQMVTIVAENRAFRITATGRARGNGAEGDLIMVQNLIAQKDIPAMVVGDGLVRVEF